jgi:hypothetical protein
MEPETASLKLSGGKFLDNVTGREVIVEACRENPELFSLIVFPTNEPRSKADADAAFATWTMRSIATLNENPVQIRSTLERSKRG